MAKKAKYLSLVVALSMLLSLAVFPQTSSSVDFEDIDAETIGAVNIDENGIGTVYGTLNLPETDKDGRTIVWSTEDEDVIDINTGKILKYKTNGDIETSVTATIGEESEIVNFKVGYLCSTPDGEPVLYEDFSDETINGEISFKSDPATASVEGGVLKMGKVSGSSGSVYIEYSIDKSYTENKSKVLIEYDVQTNDSAAGIQYDMRTSRSDSTRHTDIRMRPKVTEVQYGSNGKAIENAGRSLSGGGHFKFLLDYGKQVYTVWFGDDDENIMLAKECEFVHESDYTSLFRFADTYGNGAEHYIDNLKIYDVMPEPLSDITLITINGSDTSEVTENLNLPAQDENGNTIIWASENSNITVDGEWGIVNRTDSEVSGIVCASTVIDDITYIKEFNLTVPKYVRVFSSAPEPQKDDDGNEIVEYYERFDNITVEALESAGYLVSEDLANGETYIEDGRLVITNEDTSNEYHHRYNIGAATQNIDDRLVVEFEAERSNFQKGFRFLLIGASAMLDNAFVHTILSDGNVQAYISTQNKVVKDEYTRVGRPSKIQIMVCKDATFSMWVDGERLVNRGKMQKAIATSADVLAMNFRTANRMGSLKIDNLKIYKAAVSDVEMVENIIDSMDDESSVIKKNEKGEITAFEYTGANEHNCTIAYSSEKGLVREDGKIDFPLNDTDDIVTVTVTSPDGYSESKSFDVTIKANYVLGQIEHDIKTLGFMKGDNIFIIPASSRGNEPHGGVSVKTEVLDENGAVIADEVQSAQFLYDDAECFVGAVELTQAQAELAKKVKISLFATQTDKKLKGGEFEIIGG